jgi:hypothetical protein
MPRNRGSFAAAPPTWIFRHHGLTGGGIAFVWPSHSPPPLGEGGSILFGTNVVVRRGAGPSPSTGAGGVGVRLSGAERPSVSPPFPPSPANGEGVLTSPCQPTRGRENVSQV